MISKNAANRIIHLLIFLCALNFFPLKAAVQHLIGDRLARLRKRS